MSEWLWTVGWAVIYAGGNALWHSAGREWVRGGEAARRPLYYGVGFATFLVCVWGYAFCTGHLETALVATIIGGGGGLGMLGSYALDTDRARHQARALDAAGIRRDDEVDRAD